MSTRVVGFRTAGIEVRKKLMQDGPQTTDALVELCQMSKEDTIAMLQSMRQDGLLWYFSSDDDEEEGVWLLVQERNASAPEDDAWFPEVFEKMKRADEALLSINCRDPAGSKDDDKQVKLRVHYQHGKVKVRFTGRDNLIVSCSDVFFLVNALDNTLGMFIDAEYPMMMAIDTADFRFFKAEIKEDGSWSTLMRGTNFVH